MVSVLPIAEQGVEGLLEASHDEKRRRCPRAGWPPRHGFRRQTSSSLLQNGCAHEADSGSTVMLCIQARATCGLRKRDGRNRRAFVWFGRSRRIRVLVCRSTPRPSALSFRSNGRTAAETPACIPPKHSMHRPGPFGPEIGTHSGAYAARHIRSELSIGPLLKRHWTIGSSHPISFREPPHAIHAAALRRRAPPQPN